MFFLLYLYPLSSRIYFCVWCEVGIQFFFHLDNQLSQHYFLIDLQCHLCHVSNFHIHMSLFLGSILYIIGWLHLCPLTLPPQKTLYFLQEYLGYSLFFFNVLKNIYLFRLCRILVAACRIFVTACEIFSCGMQAS